MTKKVENKNRAF